uniref:Uncharacterized protein n=1 Tax=Anguilla anguilla TaxID=7936 RepID=A0A0E9PS03_ANGAN
MEEVEEGRMEEVEEEVQQGEGLKTLRTARKNEVTV